LTECVADIHGIRKSCYDSYKRETEELEGICPMIRRLLLMRDTIAFRLFIIYLVVISIPLFVYGFASYSLSARNVEADHIQNKVNISAQIARNIDDNALILQKQSASLFLINTEIDYMLKSGPEDTSDDYFDIKARLDRYFLALLQMNDKLSGISLINAHGELKYAISIQALSSTSASVAEETWFKESLALRGAPLFLDPHTNDFMLYPVAETKPTVISVAQAIEDYSTNKPLGVLLVDQNTKQFFADIARVNLQKGEQVVIISRTGNPIYSNLELSEEDHETLRNALQSNGISQEKVLLAEQEQLLISSGPSQYGFQVVSLLPMSELRKKSAPLKKISIVMLIIITCIVFLISIAASYIFVKPLRRMMPSFKKLEMGNFSARVPVSGTHELAQISNAFNNMVQNMENLIHEKYEANLLRKQAELAALQSQINPHFLYNTLYATKSVIDNRELEKASVMIQSLSELFRYSLDQGCGYATLRDELAHIRKYLYLHEVRFAGKHRFLFDIENRLLDCSLPRLTLQPFVENAIQHGLKDKTAGGELRLSAKSAADKLLIYIYDNGAGMDDKLIKALNAALERPFDEAGKIGEDGHIGIRNVNARIQLQYGQTYGVRLSSKPHVHTTVKITLPLTDSGRGEIPS